MTRIFVDAVFYIALISNRDDLHTRALAADEATSHDELLTTDAVLTELLDHFGDGDRYLRNVAWSFVDRLKNEGRTVIVRQTADLFDAGFDLYRRRPDKGYSHTDCMSMVVCKQQGIRRVLTHDRHFAQEGFELLL